MNEWISGVERTLRLDYFTHSNMNPFKTYSEVIVALVSKYL